MTMFVFFTQLNKYIDITKYSEFYTKQNGDHVTLYGIKDGITIKLFDCLAAEWHDKFKKKFETLLDYSEF